MSSSISQRRIRRSERRYCPHSPADVAEIRNKIREALLPHGVDLDVINSGSMGGKETITLPDPPPGVTESADFIHFISKNTAESLAFSSFKGSERPLDDRMIINRQYGYFMCSVCKECGGELKLICSECKKNPAGG